MYVYSKIAQIIYIQCSLDMLQLLSKITLGNILNEFTIINNSISRQRKLSHVIQFGYILQYLVLSTQLLVISLAIKIPCLIRHTSPQSTAVIINVLGYWHYYQG